MTDTAPDLTPRWLRDLERLLPIRSQFIISGNIRDSLLTPATQQWLVPRAAAARPVGHARRQDYRYLLVYDPADGVRVYPNEPAVVELATKIHELKLQDGVMPMGLESLDPADAQARRQPRGARRADARFRLAPRARARPSGCRRAPFLRRRRKALSLRQPDRADATSRRASQPVPSRTGLAVSPLFNPDPLAGQPSAGSALVVRARLRAHRLADRRPAGLRDARDGGAAACRAVSRPCGGRCRRHAPKRCGDLPTAPTA